MTRDRFTVVAAVNNRRILEGNLLLSPAIADGRECNIVIKEGFASASLAYNSAIDEAQSDVLVFVHQDVYLPEHWFDEVANAIRALEDDGVRWGVLGCFGSRRDANGGLGRVFTTGRGLHGNVIHCPEPVETLDEIVLITRKSSGPMFDPNLPHFHMYGVDLCLQARSRGMTNYAIPAFCVHNTNQLVKLPAEFYICYGYIKRKWGRYLPIHTSCMAVTRFEMERREKQARDFINTILGRMKPPLARAEDPRTVVANDEWRKTGISATLV